MIQSIEEIMNSIFSKLDVDDSNKREGTDVYAMVRAIAVHFYEQNRKISEVNQGKSIVTSTGRDLEDYASDLGLKRKSGLKSRGSVLALSEKKATIPKETSLTDLSTGRQYTTDSEARLPAFVEKSIPITSIKPGSSQDLISGTVLFNPDFQNIRFIAGSHRDDFGEVCGDVKGGRERESDEQLRQRVINRISNTRTNSEYLIKSIILSEDDILWVDISTPLPAYFEVWVEPNAPLSQERKSYLNSLVKLNKAAGVLSEVREVKKEGIDFDITIYPEREDINLDQLTSTVRGKVYEYLYRLSIGDQLVVDDLKRFLLKLPEIKQLYVSITQNNDKIQPESDEVIRPASLKVSYELS
jgi:hypothetical protein